MKASRKLIRFFLNFITIIPISGNRISLICNKGTHYCCNPKYIAEYLIQNNLDMFEIVWFYSNNTVKKIVKSKGYIAVRFNSILYIYCLLTSKYIISNISVPDFIPYRKSQVKVCTWHGTAFKRYVSSDSYNLKMFDYIIAENDFTAEIFTKQLDSQNFNQAIILKMGMPRNDIIIKSPIEIVNNIRCGLRLNSNTKIVLYAPTFRGAKTNDCFLLDFEMLKTELEFKYGGDWLVAFRYHPMQKDRFYLPNCIDFSDYQDMQELLLICDLLITDYSSSMWDFSLSGKPCFIFASDISNYINNERGDFLYPIEKLPFPLAQNNEELMSNIINFNVEYYKESLGKFYNEWGRYNIEGNATKQFVEFITLLP